MYDELKDGSYGHVCFCMNKKQPYGNNTGHANGSAFHKAVCYFSQT